MNKPDSQHPLLTPETKNFVDALAAQNAPPIYTLSPAEARKVLLDAQSQLKTKPPADIEDVVLLIPKIVNFSHDTSDQWERVNASE